MWPDSCFSTTASLSARHAPDVEPATRDLEHHPFVEVPRAGLAAGDEPFERLGDLRRLDLGEVAEHADVDAEQRDRRAVEDAHGAQHRAVAAEADDEVGLADRPLGRQVGEPEGGGVLGHDPRRSARARPTTRRSSGRAWRRRRAAWWATTATAVIGGACAVRAWTRNSRLPSPPRIGESIQPTTSQPSASSDVGDGGLHTVVDRRVGDDAAAAADLGAPGLELRLDEQDHRRTRLAQRDEHRDDHGERDERDVDDDGVDEPADRVGVASRMLVRSMTVTRSSARSRGCSWPCPTSRAITRRAPRESRQSVNPPVDAPTSRTTSPVTSTPKCVERGVELLAAAADEARWRTGDDDGVAGRHQARRLVGDGAVDEHPSRLDGGVRVGSAGEQAAPDELGVEPPAGRHSGRQLASPRPCFAGALRAAAFFLAGAFLAVVFLAAAFLAGAFLAGAFFAGAFFAGAFLAGAFLAGAFLAGAFFAGAFFAGAGASRPARTGSRAPRAGPRGRRPGWPASRAAWRPPTGSDSARLVAVSLPRASRFCTVASASERRTSPALTSASPSTRPASGTSR